MPNNSTRMTGDALGDCGVLCHYEGEVKFVYFHEISVMNLKMHERL